jgi:hypothetical protein
MSKADTIRCANCANTNSRELSLTQLTLANTILPLKVPLKMISLRLPSGMINSHRTDIRLLGQEHNRDGTPYPSTT